MATPLQAERGMHDIMPAEGRYYTHLEPIEREMRTICVFTDFVEKEMYTFEERNGDSLSLRPDGTAGCVRAGIEHGRLHNQVQRLWDGGAMFRHERPQ